MPDLLKSQNPFAGFGNIVYGSRFLGREEELQLINDAIIAPLCGGGNAGNVALIGEPRIGKSSIAYQSTLLRRRSLAEKGVVTVMVTVSSHKESGDLTRALVSMIAKELRQFRFETGEMEALKTEIVSSSDTRAHLVVDYLELIKRNGQAVIAVLDEFDGAGKLYAKNPEGFMFLREIAYSAETSLSWITTSRRRISRIEELAGAVSTLAGIFAHKNVRPYCPADQDEFWARIKVSVPLADEELRRHFDGLTGGHPYLLDILAFDLVNDPEIVQGGYPELERRATEYFPEVLYEKIVKLLKEEDRFDKLLQIVVGPQFDITRVDVEQFEKYGLIRKVGKVYQAFSDHFQRYLVTLAREFPTWSIWAATEETLRDVVQWVLQLRHGPDWQDGFADEKEAQRTLLEKWNERRSAESRHFPFMAAASLLSYSYPGELTGYILNHWQNFKGAFPGTKKKWSAHFARVNKLRNPLAHNRIECGMQGALREVEGICLQIGEHTRAFLKQADGGAAHPESEKR